MADSSDKFAARKAYIDELSLRMHNFTQPLSSAVLLCNLAVEMGGISYEDLVMLNDSLENVRKDCAAMFAVWQKYKATIKI